MYVMKETDVLAGANVTAGILVGNASTVTADGTIPKPNVAYKYILYNNAISVTATITSFTIKMTSLSVKEYPLATMVKIPVGGKRYFKCVNCINTGFDIAKVGVRKFMFGDPSSVLDVQLGFSQFFVAPPHLEFITERVQIAMRNIYAAVTCTNLVTDCVFEVTMGSDRETDVGVVVGLLVAIAGIILLLNMIVVFNIVVVIVLRRRQMRKPVQEEFSGLIANNVNNQRV